MAQKKDSIDITQIARALISQLEGNINDIQMQLKGVTLLHDRIVLAVRQVESLGNQEGQEIDRSNGDAGCGG